MTHCTKYSSLKESNYSSLKNPGGTPTPSASFEVAIVIWQPDVMQIAEESVWQCK